MGSSSVGAEVGVSYGQDNDNLALTECDGLHNGQLGGIGCNLRDLAGVASQAARREQASYSEALSRISSDNLHRLCGKCPLKSQVIVESME